MSNLPQTSTDGPIGSPPTTSIPLIHTNPSHKKVIIPVVSLFIFFIIVALLIIFKKKIHYKKRACLAAFFWAAFLKTRPKTT